ncbi:hypothetical protein TNCV_521601 [Trichonephila clavipes]|nr:hypothetical protein TNCV_521601 [Trichonephila clavipes]
MLTPPRRVVTPLKGVPHSLRNAALESLVEVEESGEALSSDRICSPLTYGQIRAKMYHHLNKVQRCG